MAKTPHSRSLNSQEGRIVKLLRDASLDVLVAAGPENAIYLSGAYNPVRRLLSERPAIVVWPAEGTPLLVAASVEEAFLRESSAISDLQLYVGAVEAAADTVSESLRKRGFEEARLGVDLESVSAVFYRELLRDLPKAEIVDASGLLAGLRAIKSDEEIGLLRQAAEATDRAEWTALDAFRIGWSETELGVQLRQALIGQGSESVAFLVLGGGRRGVVAHAIPSDVRLAPGEIVRFDMGGIFGGYASDLAMTACVAEPSPRQRHVYRSLRMLLDRHIARIRPGIKAGDLFQAVAADFQIAGLGFSLPHVGHGIGLSTHEWPVLTAESLAVIQPGMTICAELIYVEENRERYHLEELVLVREDGPEVISRSRSAALEIPVIG